MLALGTLTTSLVGFARSLVVARTLGAHAGSDAFFAALQVPQIVYGPLIGSAAAAVLIPTFSRLADYDRATFWLLVRTVFAVEIGVTVVMVGLLELLARPLVIGVASGFLLGVHAAALSQAIRLVRILLLGLFFSTTSGVAVATLYSLGRRVAASFAPACVHIGIIAGAFAGAAHFGVMALAIGAVVGGAAQCAIQLIDLGRQRDTLRLLRASRLIDLRHPDLRHMLRLYLPVVGGAVLALLGQVANLNFQSHLPANGELSGMQYAGQLIQFPAGIVIAALGFAVLPVMARHAGTGQEAGYPAALRFGLRASLIVSVPASLVLFPFATPIVAILFQHGRFSPLDTSYTSAALIGYAPQLPLLPINQLLVFAHYARQNTRIPAAAAAVGLGTFVTSALILFRFTVTGLAVADTLSVAAQTVILGTAIAPGPINHRRPFGTRSPSSRRSAPRRTQMPAEAHGEPVTDYGPSS